MQNIFTLHGDFPSFCLWTALASFSWHGHTFIKSHFYLRLCIGIILVRNLWVECKAIPAEFHRRVGSVNCKNSLACGRVHQSDESRFLRLCYLRTNLEEILRLCFVMTTWNMDWVNKWRLLVIAANRQASTKKGKNLDMRLRTHKTSAG